MRPRGGNGIRVIGCRLKEVSLSLLHSRASTLPLLGQLRARPGTRHRVEEEEPSPRLIVWARPAGKGRPGEFRTTGARENQLPAEKTPPDPGRQRGVSGKGRGLWAGPEGRGRRSLAAAGWWRLQQQQQQQQREYCRDRKAATPTETPREARALPAPSRRAGEAGAKAAPRSHRGQKLLQIRGAGKPQLEPGERAGRWHPHPPPRLLSVAAARETKPLEKDARRARTGRARERAPPSLSAPSWPYVPGTQRPQRVQRRVGPRCARSQRACDCSGGGGALPPQPQWPAPQRGAMGNISSNISAFQSLHIVMLGLDSAGKTTVLYRLKFNEFVNTVPTIGFNTEKIKLSNGTAKGISCHFWDVGGQEKLRPLWKSYSRCTDGIIYVVDSVDVDRLEEAKTELHKVTKFAENQGTPLLVIANKQDLPKSLPVAEIEKQLALHELIPATTYHVQPACAIIGEGLTEGMDKLYEMILKRRKSLKQKKKR
ncbi:ADP-ribosylation factor 4C [Sigmodon hispidus]